MTVLKRTFFTIFCVIAATLEAVAEIQIESRLSDLSLLVGDQTNLQIKVNGARQGVNIQFPEIEGVSFQILGPPVSSSQTLIVNGKVSGFHGLIYNIGVGAEKVGSYLITGLKVKYKNTVYPVDNFRLRVIKSDQASGMKVIAEVSDREIYLHQPLKITLKWFLMENVENYNFRFPLLDLKDNLQLKPVALSGSGTVRDLEVSGYKVPFQQYSENIKDEYYTVYRTRFQIYPFRSGVFQIPAASVKAAVKRGSELKKDFFGRLVRSPKLKNIFAVSEAIKIYVKPLPEKNRPATFSGGVGQYRIEISADASRAKTGDPLELSIRISGKGKLDNIERPLLSEQTEYKNNFAIVENTQPGDIEGGSIVFKQVIRPAHERTTQIPPVEFSYFNPESAKYVSVKSNSLALKVLPAKKVADKDIIVHGAGSGAKLDATKEGEGLRANHTAQDILGSRDENPLSIFWLAAPPLIYSLCLLSMNRRKKLLDDKALLRSKSAKKRKDKKLKTAKRLMAKDDEHFLTETSRALNGYIADNFNLGAGELTEMDIVELKQTGRISSCPAAKLTHCMNEFDRLRFTNRQMSSREKEDIFKLALDAVKELEKEL